jgi:hypothetical protein
MALQDRKRQATALFQQYMREIDFGGAVKAGREYAEIAYDDGTRVTVQMLPIKGGLGPGEFAAYTALGISDGPVYEGLEATRLAASKVTFPKHLIVAGTSHELVPGVRTGVYKFRTSTDVEAPVKKLTADIRKYYLPVVHAFTGQYERAVDFIVSTDGKHVRKPFCMCVILLGLAGSLDRVDEVVARARKSEGFWDFHKAADHASVVRRIEQWLAKRGQPAAQARPRARPAARAGAGRAGSR